MDSKTADNINTLGQFCGIRDVSALTRENLQKRYGLVQADVMVLFGGSILAGGDLLADAIANKIAKTYVIVGGAGHTTETLRLKVQQEYPEIKAEALPEAEIFARYLKYVYGCEVDYLETSSTNCGNNITYLLDLLNKNKIDFSSIILSQDASMQRRMSAGLKKYVPEDTVVINYATYSARTTYRDHRLVYENYIHGMWSIDRYVNLLMGEIPRLTDDINGYGPNGKQFITHVDIPIEVKTAYEELKVIYGERTREANPLYSSK